MSRRARAARVLLAGLVAALVALLPAPAPAQAQAQAPSPGVVVVGVAGLAWDDVDERTPTLARLAAQGARGALSVKALPAVTCPADGWLTLGAGTRAQAYGVRRDPCDGALVADRDDARRNAASRDGARLGALAEALGGAVQTVGPGAALAAGVRDGPAPVVLVDAGGLPQRDRTPALRQVDAVVAQTLAQLPGRDVLVVGLSEGPGADTAGLHVALASGPSFPRGALSSASTRRAPYVQLIDVAPTVLALLGRPVPEVMDGQPWQVDGPAPSAAALADLDTRAVAAKQATVPFFVLLLALEVTLLLALGTRPRAARLVALTGAAALGTSYVANLVPWWRAGPLSLLALLTVALALAAGAALLAARTRRPEGWVCAAVAAVVALDLVTGAGLQIDSVAGYSSLVAGRFAGLGNVAFGVYAAAVLLAAALLVGRRPLLLAGVGVVAVAVAGAPPWGSDVGGVLALVPALVVLGLLLVGARVSALRLALAVLAGGAVVAAFALADAARPPERRTHLGRFVRQVADGTAGEVLARKAQAVLGLLFTSPVTALLPLVVAAAVLLVARPPGALAAAFAQVPSLRAGLVALGVACALGFALNDSGAAVPALALTVAVPVAVAVVCGVAEQRRRAAG